jgi:hypothetical protein
MYRAVRGAWGLVAIGAATAVGVTTRNPGFIAITFIGTLALPRVLGLSPRRWNRQGFGPNAFGPHRGGWGGACAGAGRDRSETEASTPATQSV